MNVDEAETDTYRPVLTLTMWFEVQVTFLNKPSL